MPPHLNETDDSAATSTLSSEPILHHDDGSIDDSVVFLTEPMWESNIVDVKDDDDDDAQFYSRLQICNTIQNKEENLNEYLKLSDDVSLNDDIDIDSVDSIDSVTSKDISLLEDNDHIEEKEVDSSSIEEELDGSKSVLVDNDTHENQPYIPFNWFVDWNGILCFFDMIRKEPVHAWVTVTLLLLIVGSFVSWKHYSSEMSVSKGHEIFHYDPLTDYKNYVSLINNPRHHLTKLKQLKLEKEWNEKKWINSYEIMVSELHSLHSQLDSFHELLHEKSGSLTKATPEPKSPTVENRKNRRRQKKMNRKLEKHDKKKKRKLDKLDKKKNRKLEKQKSKYSHETMVSELHSLHKKLLSFNKTLFEKSGSLTNEKLIKKKRKEVKKQKKLVKDMSQTLEDIIAFYDEGRDLKEVNETTDNLILDDFSITDTTISSSRDHEDSMTTDEEIACDNYTADVCNAGRIINKLIHRLSKATIITDDSVPMKHSAINDSNGTRHEVHVEDTSMNVTDSFFEKNLDTTSTERNDGDQNSCNATVNNDDRMEYSTETNQDEQHGTTSKNKTMKEPDSSDLAYIPRLFIVDMWDEDPEIVLDAMRELVDMLAGNEDDKFHSIQVIHREVGGFATLIGALRRWYKNESIQAVGLESLRLALQTDWSVFQKTARTTEAVHVVLAAMNNHQANEYVQEAGCGSLNALSRTSSNYRSKLVTTELKILEATMNAIQLYPLNAYIRKYSSKTLYKMSRWDVLHKPIQKAGGTKALKRALKASYDDEETQKWIKYAIRRLDQSE